MNKLIKKYLKDLLLLLFLIISTGVTQAQKNQQKITFGTLLEELLNRENLSQTSAGMWTLHQASSYDRLYVTPDDPVGWYANHD